MTTAVLRTLWRCPGCKHECVRAERPEKCPGCHAWPSRPFGPMKAIRPVEPGHLFVVGHGTLGWSTKVQIWKCHDCNSDYLQVEGYPFTINGWEVSKCPWCRVDSRPWWAGRGV